MTTTVICPIFVENFNSIFSEKRDDDFLKIYYYIKRNQLFYKIYRKGNDK